ncbi:5'-3' exoribonuclease 1 [Tritrichomonas musculus]|uniref:5'-3' exoribonuclease 1 n=1 Tax=Tritrichomonas musculus TaxID=1915356 RepID=A0ABR2KPA7_9EUKA
MGIKGLNRWLKNNKQIRTFNDISKIRIDTLFVDGQQLYYGIKHDIVKEENQDDIQVFIELTNSVLDTFQPEEYVYVGMDGPNPAAKFQKQRHSRYNEAIDMLKQSGENFVYLDENQCQSEMKEEIIDDVLKKFLSEKVQQQDFKTKHILYSGRKSPGEAEHKYFDYFRKQKESRTLTKNQNHFILSNDNDFIFLTLQFIDENFYVIKFNLDDQKNMTYNIIDISSVREYFLSQIQNKYYQRTNSFKKRVIDDIIALSFILGNDFIPDFNDIEPYCHSFNQLIKSYSYLNKDKRNDYQFLIENECFKVSTLQNVVLLFFKNIEYNQNRNSNRSHNTQKRKEKCHNKIDPNQKNKAQSLLRMFNFCYLYYSEGTPSWTYYYPYKETLTLKDAVELMTQEGKEFFASLDDNEITDPFLKALVTHPAYHTASLPWNIYKIKIPSHSPIADKYWPLIDDPQNVPIFDLKNIKIYYKIALETLSQEEKELNKLDIPFYEYNKHV